MFLPTYCIVLDGPIFCFPISTIQHHIYLSECDTIDSKYCHWRNISHLYDGCFFGLDYLLLRPGHQLIISLDIQRWPGDCFMSLVSILCLDSNIILIHLCIRAVVDRIHIRTWNAPDAHPLQQIFVNPGWHYILLPHLHPPIDWEYYQQLNYKLHNIHVWQAREFWKVWCQFAAPINIALACHGSFILCCIANIIESILTVSWYTSWIVAYKLGILCKTTTHSSWMPRDYSLYKTSSHFQQKMHHQCRKHQHISLLATRLWVFNTVLNINDMASQRSTINFDSNTLSVIGDNSTNVHVCNDKNIFVSKIQPLQSHAVATIGGSENQAAGIGNVQWCWKDIFWPGPYSPHQECFILSQLSNQHS